jgi:hypothetical protein
LVNFGIPYDLIMDENSIFHQLSMGLDSTDRQQLIDKTKQSKVAILEKLEKEKNEAASSTPQSPASQRHKSNDSLDESSITFIDSIYEDKKTLIKRV